MQRFQWKLLDKLIIVSMVVYAAALSMTTPFEEWLENRLGFVMDTAFAYFVVRLVLVNRQQMTTVIKALGVVVVFLAVHGVVETFTGWSIYKGLGVYCPWATGKGMEYQTRYGLNRSMGPSGETIMFGLTFAALMPLFWMLRHEPPPWGRRSYFLVAAAIVGVGSTVSSGPYMALIITLICLALERAKALVKPALVMIIIGCVFIEIVSNRHVYYVIGDFTMDPESAWYRARLIDVAVDKLPEYWKYGYGFGDPGWGPYIDGRNRSDGVNDYIVQAVLYGIGGLIAYVSVLTAALCGVVLRYRAGASSWLQSSIWALMASMVGLMTAFWSVSLFGQTISLLYVLLGLFGAFALDPVVARPATVTETRPSQLRGVRVLENV
jgi:hypothetical protein